MSIILGINCLHADSSACIIKDGKLEFAIEEERLNREKHTPNLPILSIKECLNQAKINSKDITHIAFNTKPNSNFFTKINFLIKNFSFKNNYVKRFYDKNTLDKIFLKKFEFNSDVKFYFIEHHLAHISSAFYASEFNDAIGLSIDGSGDFTTMMIAECSNENIKVIDKINFPDSLGIFYHSMTQFLGFKNFGDEYKVMGLASYGKPKYFEKIKENLVKKNKNFFKLNMKYFKHGSSSFDYSYKNINNIPNIYSEKLIKLFDEDIKNSHDEIFKQNLSSSVQKIYEFYFEKVLDSIKDSNFSKNLVFAGGCALNSTANKILIKENFPKNIFIPIAPGDNGGCLGAAYLISKKKVKDNNFNNPYVGSSFSNNEVESIILKKYLTKINYEKFESDKKKYNQATDIIINNGVIGWFQGKMEFGPRALGNRSILADPRNPKIKELINLKIKRRESFRPFAPSILSKMQNEWYEEKFNNKYMSSVMTTKRDKAKLIPGVVHVDNTSRVQTVFEEINKIFYELILNFYYKTNVPMLLNTSFNENEPIVRTPDEAIDCLLRTNMDALFINDFFITKN